MQIKSPYLVSEGNFPDENYATLASDRSAMNGCDQLAVIITQSQHPGLGSLATDSDLTTRVRSVGRVAVGPGDNAPAMLLLKRTGCPVLQTGSASGGSTIRLYGAVSSDGRSQPGSIHADSNGTGCSGGSNTNIFLGKANNGIVAFAAPLPTNLTQADPSHPGVITSVAGATLGLGVGYDSASNVFGSGALNDGGIPSATKYPPAGRSLVTRKPVDVRYLPAVANAVSAASSVFATTAGFTSTNHPGWVYAPCSAGTVTLPATPLTAADKLYIQCNNTKTVPVINAGTVAFSNIVSPAGLMSMPTRPRFTSGAAVAMESMSAPALSACTPRATSPVSPFNAPMRRHWRANNKATLFVKDGQIKQSNGGLLQLCYTTMVMMGGHSDGCLPSTNGTAPTQSPCGGAMGTGQLSQNGGNNDWTAPNSLDVTTDTAGNSTAAALAGWGDINGPEDLAMWSESAGSNSGNTYNMNGQGILHTVGIYMVPNADSFAIGGGSSQSLFNAQYIATSIALNGAGTSISMKVDPNSAVTLPMLNPFTLVR